MATYYVDPAGDNSDGTTWAKAKKTITAGMALMANGDTLKIRYAEYATASNYIYTNKNDILVTAEFPDNPSLYPILNGAGVNQYGLYPYGTNQTFSGLHLKNWNQPGYFGIFQGAVSAVYNDIWVENCAQTAANNTPVWIDGGDSTFNRLRVFGHTNTVSYGVRIRPSVTGTVTLNYPQIVGESGQPFNSGIYDTSPGRVNIYNPTIIGCYQRGVYSYTTSVTPKYLYNPIISMVLVSPGSTIPYPVDIGTNTVLHISNPILMTAYQNDYQTKYQVLNAAQLIWDDLEEYNPNVFANPYYNNGIMTIGVDIDSYPIDTCISMAEIFQQEGIVATFYANQCYFDDGGANGGGHTSQDLLDIQSYGQNIGSHGWSHSGFNISPLKAFQIKYTGTGVCTMTIAENSLTTAIVGGAGEEVLNYDLTTYSTKLSHIYTLCQAINALPNYATNWNPDLQGLQKFAQAKILDDVVQIIDGTYYDMPINKTRLMETEIIDNNSWVESVVGAPCKAFAYAYNRGDDDTIAFMRALDGVSSGQKITNSRGPGTAFNWNLSSYDAFDGHPWTPTELDNATNWTDNALISAWRNFGNYCRIYGLVIWWYTHASSWDGVVATPYGADMTATSKARLRTMINSLKLTGVKILPADTLAEYLDANGWTYNAGTTSWDKDLGTPNYDFSLNGTHPGSLDPYAGVISMKDQARKSITDSSGNLLVPFVSIGAYQGIIGGGGLSPGLGLSGGNRPPWWHRRR